MSLEDELSKYGSLVGEAGDVIDKGLDIFSNVRSTFFPDTGVPKLPVPTSQPEPLAAESIVKTASPLSMLSDNPILLIGIAVIGYLVFIHK